MNYVATINTLLKPAKKNGLKVLDLYAGAGGLALGFEAQGFETIGYEMDEDCCKTYERNLKNPCKKIKITTDTDFPKVDIIIGGPPCQPFSVRGNQKGVADERNGFPAFIKAVEKIKPKLFVIENVRGLLYQNKHYLDEVVTALKKLGYQVDYQLFNFVDFGVPQKRERVVIVGHKGNFSFPEKLTKITTAGEAIEDLLKTIPENPKFLTPAMETYIAKYEAKSSCVTPRDLHLDRPARTLTCRNLAGATSDMHRVKLPDGRRRRITTKEAARLQSFPDHYVFEGNETSIYYQIGNAVPPLFAYQLAGKVKEYFGLSLTKNLIDPYKIKQNKLLKV
jgi:DNA (cytosine-5)-methyltransferase 1